jgi:6-phosphofructokinase
MNKTVKKVGILTAGGLAPCLSAAIGYLIETYTRKAPEVEIICYVNGYMGLLQGNSLKVTPEVRTELEGVRGARRQPHRQQPREADECEGLCEARLW